MATSKRNPATPSPVHEVLTLAEAATYLRISEDALEKLAVERAVPSRKIGDEWRFSRIALDDWLRCVPVVDDLWVYAGLRRYEHPLWEKLLAELEGRLVAKLATGEPATPGRGSRERLRELAGAWKDDPSVDDLLRQIYKERGRPMTERDQ